jgi:asparagine synthase (glutamine-hydrolysing)
MCGIAGFVRAQGPLPSADLIERMKSAMVHRGPDAHGTFVNENVALGHQRLKIIDLSSAADQPFRSEDGRYIMVFNGEIYNYRQIKEELGVTRYRSESDTEVLLLAFMKWGRSCLERLNGMFSFAIWDEQEQELFVARDRLGIKPLYYYHGDEGFVFASEMRALLASGIVPRRIDDGALAEYLAFHTVHAPRTIVRNVQMLEPGHFLTLRKGELMDTCYWDLATNRLQIDDSYDNVKAQIRRRLLASVERRLIADVPIGAFLSGGIDSSALVALISEVRETPIHTFSVVFDEEEFSEKQYADRVAGRFNTKHHTLPLKAGDLLDNLPRILLETDHPSVDGPNTHVISEATKKAGITVAISGLGGDELFAGYPVFRQLPALLNNPVLGKIPLSLRKGV